jgi:hypothetical protein
MCGPHFCSMKITQDVRDYAAKLGVSEQEALKKGMEEKAVEFVRKGGELYQKSEWRPKGCCYRSRRSRLRSRSACR